MFITSFMFFVVLSCARSGFYFVGKYVLGAGLVAESFVYLSSAIADTSVQGNWFSFW